MKNYRLFRNNDRIAVSGLRLLSFSVLFAGSLIISQADAAGIKFNGTSHKVFEEKGDAATGLDYIYVLYDLNNVSAEFELKSSSSTAKLYRFSMLGGGYAEEIENISKDGKYLLFPKLEGDMGYIVEEDSRRYCYWVIDYSRYRANLSSLELYPDGMECGSTELLFKGEAGPIHYYTINGRQQILSRELEMTYDNQVWHEDESEDSSGAGEYFIEKVYDTFESCQETILVSPPNFCSTSFTLSGDRFLKYWGEEMSVSTSVELPVAVEVHTSAVQQKSELAEGEASNELRSEDSGLGGSAPAEIEFSAWVTEGVLFQEWQISNDPEFGIVDYRFPQLNLNHTFREEGTWYVRFIGANADGSCQSEGETYTVTIGASELLCPNAFTPDGDGVNDVWKVAYKSLLDFECWIFDRFGVQMAHFDNPDSGWDGKYGGKTVRSGVYYYVINATGADGKKYKKSGDINIIRHKTYNGAGAAGYVVE